MTKATKPKAKRKLTPLHIQCKGCFVKFIPKDKRQHFHSTNCRVAYYQRTYYAKVIVTKTCPNCGDTFPTSKPHTQIYCIAACREDASQKRSSAVVASVDAERLTFLAERTSTFERDDYKCTLCGKGPKQGIHLDVIDDGKGGLKTICNECKEGRDFKGGT